MWLASRPMVHGPRWVSTTPVGPTPHFCVPRLSSVAVGHRKAGPRPQISPPAVGFDGERKKLWVVSPRPNSKFGTSRATNHPAMMLPATSNPGDPTDHRNLLKRPQGCQCTADGLVAAGS